MRYPIAFAIILSCLPILASDEKPDAKITLKKLVEKRELEVEKGPFSGWENGIELTLHVDGAGVKDARQVGRIKVTKATDDAGTDLTKKTGDVPMQDTEHFDDVREPQSFGFGNNEKKQSGFDVNLKLPAPSARSAKSIKLLSGSLQVIAGGEKKIVEIKTLKDHYGKKLDDPALKAAGISFTLADPSKPMSGVMSFGEKGKSLTATLEGSLDTMGEVNVVNASGEKLNMGRSWSDEGGKRMMTYDLKEQLPADAKLTIEVFPGQKILTVPFEFKDVKLP